MKAPETFVVKASDVPPIRHEMGQPTRCGWCKSHIGEEHDADCVCRKRTVVLRFAFEIVAAVPEAMTPEQLVFLYNGNRICATDHLDRLVEADPCLCDSLSFVREASVEDEARLPWSYKVSA